MNPNARKHLRAIIAEYFVVDDRVPEAKLLELLIGAVIKPTRDQPLVVQTRVAGTRAHKLYNTPSNALTEDEQRFLEGIDDFRTRVP